MERNYRFSALNRDLISSRLNALFQGDLVFSAARYGQYFVLIFIICSQDSTAHDEVTGESFALYWAVTTASSDPIVKSCRAAVEVFKGS